MEDVAGYRMLRSAGRGERAQLVLGFDEGRTVVLKITDRDDPAVEREVEALSRGAGEHVVGLLDVHADRSQSVLVLERLPGGTLAELLERRGAFEAGEAVTILAPLAATIERLHAVGVAHGRLSPTAVAFREDGAPVLTGFGSAELFAPGSPEVVRETVDGVRADRDALAAIAGVVLGLVVGERAAAARRLAEQLGQLAPDALDAALFGLATPTAVRFEADLVDPGAARVGDLQVTAPPDPEGPTGVPPWLLDLLPEGLRDGLTGAVARARLVWAGWMPRRRRLVLGGAAGVVTVLLALALVPAGPGPSTARPSPPDSSAASPETMESAPEPALPDDPVEAAVVLLQTREQCLRDLSALCLDAVVQPGSSAFDDDLALIRAVQQGGEMPDPGVVPGAPTVVERLGDSVLLDLPEGSAPASLLLLRTTNGWRIRGYLENPAPEAPAVLDESG